MVHILMATYNGARYISAQIDSITAQTVSDWRLHICDDASGDDTREIIQSYIQKYPNKIHFMENENNQGAKATFGRLVREVREPGDYMFCDQDDIWHPEKISILQQGIRTKEAASRNGKTTPMIVFADMEVIDEKEHQLADSLSRQSGLVMPDASMEQVKKRLYLYNFVQGASMMWNSALHEKIKGIPGEAIMHDWWFALVAATYGEIHAVDKVLGKYRQHGENVVGAFDRKQWRKSILKKLRISNIKQLKENNKDLKKQRISQAEAFNKAFGDETAETFLKIVNQKNRFIRAYKGIHSGYIFLSTGYSVKFYIL